ncbi:MAG TPA: hypothetical protein VGO55_11050 [Allosphingosinicella sp.]|jgi:hypothetical protein|nr:hypothetical protein [Allosphingosinicella sp.]
MRTGWDRNSTVGCLALLVVAAGALYLASDPRAGERREREAALREQCIRDGRAAYRVRHRGAEMSRAQAADLVGRCFGEARLNSN